MKKELFTAIAIGAIFGFIITGSFWAIQEGKIQSLFQKNTDPEITENDIAPDPENTPAPQEENLSQSKIYLKIESPQNEIIVSKSTLEITGQSEPLSIIAILHKEGDEIIEADEDGNFEHSIDLAGGLNVIKITSFNIDGESTEEVLHITYSTAKI